MERIGTAAAARAGGVVLACLAAAVLSSAALSPADRPAAKRTAAHTAQRPGAKHRPGPAPSRTPSPVGRVATLRAATPAPTATFPPDYRVGAVFSLAGQPHHYCTGSVVDSPHRDLVITAAHCVHGGAGSGYRTGLGFAPGYRDGRSPAGLWRVRTTLVAPEWANSTDSSADVAFLVVEPLDGRNIQDVVGGNRLSTGHDRGPIRLVGYPRNANDAISCEGTAQPAQRRGVDQLRVFCPGFTSGTSGSPWLADPNPAGGGSVVGVIGGYRNGGTTPDVSYSSVFGERVQDLYESAVALG
ncbi:trypsin-like serine peptidase [Streptantibioticus ferralitis]|uniref:Trypsin-like peptidase domain-containing protein n=1 Tax=Streptantibioticus ferralitis TaxID=236510 RepID=A0ABT5YVD2_9ACTN|nr:trypsin-like peptidase domain-containing protein [Streptantibioticus ferralitis]MDF2254775.1 trypsin-like peptidase domain-containing protein [Streptantibioticus ferralitis]